MDTGIHIARDSNGRFYTKNGLGELGNTKRVSLPYYGSSNDDIFFDNGEITMLLIFLYDESYLDFQNVKINRVYFNKNSSMIIVPNIGE